MEANMNKNLTLKNVRITFRNFRGKGSQFNREGCRKFSIVLSPDVAEKIAEDGWKVKKKDPREEGDDPLLYLEAELKYKNIKGEDVQRPPKVVMIRGRKQKELTEKTVGILDTAEIENVDVTLRPYNWEMKTARGMESGIKAYVKTLYVTIAMDELEAMYADMDEDEEEVPFD
jgi:hypothetical protein